MEISYTVGARIKYIREYRHMSQRELGEKCGFPKKSANARMYQYENGLKTPAFTTMCKFADILDVSVFVFFDFTSSMVDLSIYQMLFWAETFGVINPFNRKFFSDIALSPELARALNRWEYEHERLIRNEITSEEYQEWKWHFEI